MKSNAEDAETQRQIRLGARRTFTTREDDLSPKVMTLSGDNRRALLTNPDDNSVSVVDIIAGKQITTFATGKKPDGIGWQN